MVRAVILRVAERRRFTCVDQRAIRDNHLSLRARGLLVWLLDKPDGWQIDRDAIARQVPEGQHVIRGALAELTTHGYLVRRRERLEGGRFATVTVLYEYPPDLRDSGEMPAHTAGGLPPSGSPTSGSPTSQRETLTGKTEKTFESTPSATTGGNGKKPRPRDPLFDALACAGRRVDLAHLPASTARTIAVKVAELRAAQPDVTPEEITRRAHRYRREHPDWALTPAALVKHWAELAPEGSSAPRGPQCSRCAVRGPLRSCTLKDPTCPGEAVVAQEANRG